MARWQNGYAAACKAVYAGSIPTLASIHCAVIRRAVVRLAVLAADHARRGASRSFPLNLSRFDEPLLPELEALRKSKSAPLDDNAYPFALGFLATKGRDPRAAGVEIIGVLQARRDRGEPATIGKEEKQAILGAPLANDGLAYRVKRDREAAFGTDEFVRPGLPASGQPGLRAPIDRGCCIARSERTEARAVIRAVRNPA